jgi:hypothetical protein
MTTLDRTTIEKPEPVLESLFHVVHPLDDVPEEKLCPARLNMGLMHMSGSRRWSLLALRAYLIVIVLLVSYRGLDLAGVFAHLGH